MNDDSYDNDLLFKYLEGELSPAEAEQIEARLSTDSDLRQRLETLRLARRAVGHYGLVEQVGAIHREMMPSLRRPATIAWMRRPFLAAAATFIVLLTLATFYMYRQSRSSNIYQEHFYPYVLTADRGGGQAQPLSAAYKKGQMADVVNILHGLASPSASDYFLAANAFLSIERPDSAIKYFRALLEMDSQRHQHELEEDTEYYLAMSYLQAGLVAEAMPLFRKIHDDPQHSYHDKVGAWFMQQLRWAH